MIFFFGTRSNRIAQRPLKNVTCTYCQTQNSFVSTTFGSYAHFFWIPIVPISKTTVAECSHCKKTYSKNEFTDQMLRSLEKENTINPTKRPIWHGCGCLIIASVIVLSLISGVIAALFGGDKTNVVKDVRKEQLKVDKQSVTSNLSFKTDSISFAVQQCVNFEIDGIDTNKIKYASSIIDNKLMLILKVSDMKKIEKSSRKELVFAVEDCLESLNYNSLTEHYIAVDGNWNMLLVKTPYESDLGGKYANEELLLSFYGEKEKAILKNSKNEETENTTKEKLETED